MESDQLDGIASIRGYIDRVVTSDGRMKVLLLDATTTQIVACVSSQSEILAREVYLVSRLDEPRSEEREEEETARVGHLKAVCFLRPTEANVGLLVKELASPRFAEYHLHFAGLLPPALLRLIAENDPADRVQQVHEGVVVVVVAVVVSAFLRMSHWHPL